MQNARVQKIFQLKSNIQILTIWQKAVFEYQEKTMVIYLLHSATYKINNISTIKLYKSSKTCRAVKSVNLCLPSNRHFCHVMPNYILVYVEQSMFAKNVHVIIQIRIETFQSMNQFSQHNLRNMLWQKKLDFESQDCIISISKHHDQNANHTNMKLVELYILMNISCILCKN